MESFRDVVRDYLMNVGEGVDSLLEEEDVTSETRESVQNRFREAAQFVCRLVQLAGLLKSIQTWLFTYIEHDPGPNFGTNVSQLLC